MFLHNFQFLKIFPVLFLIHSLSPISAQNCSSVHVFKQSDDELIFAQFRLQLADPIALFDGPTSISAAPNETVNTITMTTEQIKYYNYFSASMYCPTSLATLSCCYCGQFNATVTDFAIFTDEELGTKALVTLHSSLREIVVTFRGSVSFMNWIMDLTLLPTPFAGAEVHTGFYLSLMSVYNQVVKKVGLLLHRNPGFHIVVNGHSLGGAMSSLLIFLLTSLDQFPGTHYSLVTFGQPRTGNVRFADYMNALKIPMSRVVARADIIPHVPPVSALGIMDVLASINYVHHTQEVRATPSGHIPPTFCSKNFFEDPTCSNSLGPKYSLGDHEKYFDADYTVCYMVEGWLGIDLVTVKGFTPTNFIPPMPTPMQGFMTGFVDGGYQGALPGFGKRFMFEG
ncbi:lipase-like [Folsomia candida]|uniref:lipase-like n=1 Tax=Folsomia candida TaxID=158441 RepID=UPI001604C611|nr:lipase-like [Folsomia candida]